MRLTGTAPTPHTWGLAIDANDDVVLQTRAAERLGFEHVALDRSAGKSAALLCLGASDRIRIICESPPSTVVEGGAAITGDRVERLCDRSALSSSILSIDSVDVLSGKSRRELRRSLGSLAESIESPSVTLSIAGHSISRRRAVRAVGLALFGHPGILCDPQGRRLLYAEDLYAGQVFELGCWQPDEREILDFAEQWDPLDFHQDAERAADTPLGHLCASGVHSISAMQRLGVDGFYRFVAIVAGRGMRDARLRRPVLAGMRLDGRIEIIKVDRRLNGRAVVTTRGILSFLGDIVLEYTGEAVVLARSHVPMPSNH